MILSDVTVKEYIASGKIKIYPEADYADIRPTGIRLHLSKNILIPIKNQVIDLSTNTDIKLFDTDQIPEEGFLLKPGMFILGATRESIMTPNDIVGYIEGRSTIARLGIAIHCTSGVIDSNYDEPRSIVLEIKNQGPFDLILKPGIALGMLLFSELTHPIEQPSQSQYQGQSTVSPPNLNFLKSDK
jgi:dCTP deaminase